MKEQLYKAFADQIQETLSSESPDYDWITRLYSEIKERLQKFVRPTNKLYLEMDEKLDALLFRQMLEYQAFSGEDFVKLLNFIFGVCLQLGAPARDVDVCNKKKILLEKLENGASFHEIVASFILEINGIIDVIELDIINLLPKPKN